MENIQNEREQGIGAMSKSMLIVMALTMVSKVTGFLRETVLAAQFGATDITDAFKTADLLPCIILSVIVTAISTTLIPVYADQLKHGQEKANRFINNVFCIGLVFSVIILVLTFLFMEPIAMLFMQDADEQTRQLAVRLAKVMMPMGIFVFLSRITSAYLQANFNFTIPALSQLFLNVTIIASILLSRGANIMYVAIGTVLGWALQFLVQIPSVRRAGFKPKPVFDVRGPGLREVLILMVPVLFSSAFDQLYMLFDRMVAFRGDIGDPTKLDYANRISTMVSAVLLTTVATVLYPNLVKHAENREKFTDSLSFGINLNLLIAIPAMLGIILLSLPVTRIVYERGMFTAEDTRLTATLLACYCAGILGVGIRELCFRCFYAMKDTIIPTIIGISVVLLNVILNYALHPIFGPAGIAVATSISTTASALVLLFLLHHKRHVVDGKRIFRCLWKTLVATGAMVVALLVLYQLFHLTTAAGITLWLGVALTVVVSIAVYAIVLLLLRTEEFSLALGMLRKRLRKG